MNVKEAYYYLFYKLYKLFDNGPANWLSDWKAELIIDVLFIFIGLSVIVYYTAITKEWLNFENSSAIIFAYIALIAVPNYLIFHHKNQWKDIVEKFDKWPKGRHQICGLIVYVVVLLIVFNLVFAFYLMSQIDWSQYR